MLLRAICAFVLFGILVAGLWPFHAARNDVSWLNHKNGLLFGKYGSIVSASSFEGDQWREDGSCTIEIWLEPKRVHASGTILAFYLDESEVTSFALRQSLGDLVLQHANQDQSQRSAKVKIYVDDVFSQQNPVLVTMSSSQAGTTVYADGVFVKKFANFRLSSKNLTGHLIVGNSPVTTDEWSGQLRGMAIYNRDLTANEVSQHFANWTSNQHREIATSKDAVAIYVFDEGTGNVVHNYVAPATDLIIPKSFFVLHEQFLVRPWDEFRQDWNYWKNVGINIAGFIPLGFFFYAFFSLARRAEHPVAITIAFGFAVSLTIEVLQAFLPTRDSGMTDVITNTLGTAVGVIAARHKAGEALLAAAGICAGSSKRAGVAS
jgi:hypothetical protein